MTYFTSAAKRLGPARGHRALPTVRPVLLCLLAVLAVPCVAQESQTLNAGAKLHVTMANEPEVSGDYTVDAAGNVQMLYVGQVHLAGLTAAQASTRLVSKDSLGRYYKHPQVVVTLLSAGGISVGVTGAVATQGPRLTRTDARLNDVLQQSMPALDADLGKVLITHGGPGDAAHPQDTVNYLAFLNTQDPAGNPSLQDNDVVFVPRKEAVAIQVVVRGQVAKPGQAATPAKTTVYDALQAAGGLLADADRKGISVQHAGAPDQVAFDYDAAQRQLDDATVNPPLRDGDTVIVNAAAVSYVYTITGAVRSPLEYSLPSSPTTLADAIGRAGGLAERARLKETTIIRKGGKGGAQTLKLDITDPARQASVVIQPGDNINIPQGAPKKAFEPLSLLGGAMSLLRLFGGR